MKMHTPPPFDFCVVACDLSNQMSWKPSMSMASLGIDGESQVSVKHKRQDSLKSQLYRAKPLISSVLLQIDLRFAIVIVGSGGLLPRRRTRCLTPPFFPRLRRLWFGAQLMFSSWSPRRGTHAGRSGGWIPGESTVLSSYMNRGSYEIRFP